MFDFVFITPEEAAELGIIKGEHNIEYYEQLSNVKGECDNCSNPVWKLVDNGLCFSCTTGGTDASNDYELE